MAGDKMQRLESVEELKACLKSAQDTAFITNGLARTSLEGDDEVVTINILKKHTKKVTINIIT